MATTATLYSQQVAALEEPPRFRLPLASASDSRVPQLRSRDSRVIRENKPFIRFFGSCYSHTGPSGASTGQLEALELRDGDACRYHRKGTCKAVANITDEIGPGVNGYDPEEQERIDELLIQLDGTQSKARLGANAVLAVSMAVARAAAQHRREPLYVYLGGPAAALLPLPLMNVLNGGVHANNSVDFQEFLIVPFGAPTFADALRMGAEVFHLMKRILQKKGHSTAVGDEGGFAPV